jgi:hypothetical protein
MSANKTLSAIKLYTSRCSLPIPFIRHAFFVIEYTSPDGSTSSNRCEVLHFKNKDGTHIHNMTYRGNSGMRIFHWTHRFLWNSRLEWAILTETTPLTTLRLESILLNVKNTYPYTKLYRLFGPNSNSFIRWVFNELGVYFELPKNCIGR